MKFFIDYYEDCKTHITKINELLEDEECDQIDLSFKYYKCSINKINKNVKSLIIISKIMNMNMNDLLEECNIYRMHSIDITSSNHLPKCYLSPIYVCGSKISFEQFINKKEQGISLN